MNGRYYRTLWLCKGCLEISNLVRHPAHCQVCNFLSRISPKWYCHWHTNAWHLVQLAWRQQQFLTALILAWQLTADRQRFFGAELDSKSAGFAWTATESKSSRHPRWSFAGGLWSAGNVQNSFAFHVPLLSESFFIATDVTLPQGGPKGSYG